MLDFDKFPDFVQHNLLGREGLARNDHTVALMRKSYGEMPPDKVFQIWYEFINRSEFRAQDFYVAATGILAAGRSDRVFFVLNGFLNGEDGVRAAMTGCGDQRMVDGWYFVPEGYDDPLPGRPYLSREAARVADAEWHAPERLVLGLKFCRMSAEDYAGYAAAPPNAYIHHTGSEIDLIFDPAFGRIIECGPNGAEIKWSRS